MMDGEVPELACGRRLRSCDSKVEKKEEKKKMHRDEEEEERGLWSSDNGVKNKEGEKKMHSDDEEVVEIDKRSFDNQVKKKEKEKKKKMRSGDDQVNNTKAPTDDERIKMSSSANRVKNKEKKTVRGYYGMVNNRKSTTSYENEKEKKRKRLNNHSFEKNMQSGHHHKDKRKSVSRSFNMVVEKEKNSKMLSSRSGEKIHGGGHGNDKRSRKFSLQKSHSGEKNMHIGDHGNDKNKISEKERKVRRYDGKSTPSFDKEKEKKRKRASNHSSEKNMHSDHHHEDKRRSVSRVNKSKVLEKEKKTKMLSSRSGEKIHGGGHDKDKRSTKFSSHKSHCGEKSMHIGDHDNCKKENKRKEPPVLSNKEGTEDKYKKPGSGDRGKDKTQCANKEQKVHSGLTFFKPVCTNFKEYLLIPPMVAPKLADLTDQHVDVEDSEGKSSKIRLSEVNGSLAFSQGWNDFASDHLIKWGDFLLFDHVDKYKFSVRVFSMDSRERLCFNVERHGSQKKQKQGHTRDDPVSCHKGQNPEDINAHYYVSGEHLGSKEPKTAPDDHIMNSGDIASRNLVAKSIDATSERHCMTATTKEHPNRVVTGVEQERSLTQANKDDHLANGEHKAKSDSPVYSKGKTRRCTILITDEAPLAHGTEDAMKLAISNASSGTHLVTGNTQEDPKGVTSGAGRGSYVALDNEKENLVTGKCKTLGISPTYSKEKPGLEIIPVNDATPLTQENSPAAELTTLNVASETHHVTVNTKEATKGVASGARYGPSVALDNEDEKIAMGDCKTKSASPTCSKEKISGSEIILVTHAAPLTQENDDAAKDRRMIKGSEPEDATPTKSTEMRDSNEELRKKQEGNIVRLEYNSGVDTCLNNSKMKTNVNACRKYEAPGGSPFLEEWKKGNVSDHASLGCNVPTRPEKGQKTDGDLVGNCAVVGLNPVERCGSINSIVHPVPHNLPEFGHTKPETDHSVNRKVSTNQIQIKKEQWEPLGSLASRQRNNIPERVNHAVAHQSENGDGNSTNSMALVETETMELDDRCELQMNLQFCIPSITQTWLLLPNPLPRAIRRPQKGMQKKSVIMLKDPMKSLWPVFYHENSLFVGFTTGWKSFVAANDLQEGDICTILKDEGGDKDEPVYPVEITKERLGGSVAPTGTMKHVSVRQPSRLSCGSTSVPAV